MTLAMLVALVFAQLLCSSSMLQAALSSSQEFHVSPVCGCKVVQVYKCAYYAARCRPDTEIDWMAYMQQVQTYLQVRRQGPCLVAVATCSCCMHK